MALNLRQRLEFVKESLVKKELYEKTVRIGTYIVLFSVGILMTILNIFTVGIGPTDLLTITTAVFSIVALICFLLSLIGPKCDRIAGFIFAVDFLAMFTVFLISGKPEGFSAIWICLLPLGSMLFYGRKKGSILCGIMFLFMILLFWVKIYRYLPFLDAVQNIETEAGGVYTNTFIIRFPILYASFYFLAFILESIQDYQFSVLEKVIKINEGYSTHDQLTGLFNRKGFYDHLDNSFATKPYNKIGFIIFDLDYFKKLNDKHGHLAGDFVLVEFAVLLAEKLPNSLASCRWGGEEFVVCYVDNKIKKEDLEEFRNVVQKHEFVYEGKKMKLTVSGGVFETNDKNKENESLWLKNADTALYKAKEKGRNQIIYF